MRVALVVLAACGPAIQPARRTTVEPPSERELDAARRVDAASCSQGFAFLFPGVGQACFGKPVEGAVLATLGAGELATGTTVAATETQGVQHPGAGVPLIAVQDLWVYSLTDTELDFQRAHRYRYVPQDTLAELAIAPFNLRVLSKPDVALGILGMTALGVGVSLLVDETFDTTHLGERPNVFGRQFSRPVGYSLAGGVAGGLFEHVAIAEETLFRGQIQSALTRSLGETQGWLWGSLVFGAFHATNALLLPADQRASYLLIGVPFITLVGSWLGASYHWHDYSLAPSVAEHFWYDFLESATFFLLDPQHSSLSASIAVPF